MIIKNNLSAMSAERQFNIVSKKAQKSSQKLGSGFRINSAADDAAGLTISEKMRSQIRGLNQADKNVQDGISLIQVADGAMAETQDILQRMNELAVKSSNGTNTSSDRDAVQKEIEQLKEELDRIAGSTQFNSMNLLDGSLQRTTTTVQSNKKFLDNMKGTWITDALSRIEDQTGWSINRNMTIGIDIRDLGNKVIASNTYDAITDVTINFNSYYMNDDVSYGSSGPVIGGTLTDRLLTSQLTDAIIKENSIASDIPSWFTTGLAGSVIGDEISFGEQGNISLETAKEQILKFDYKSNEISKMTTKAGILAVGYLHTLDTDGDSVSEWSSLMNEMKTAPTFEAAIQAAYGQPLHTIIDQMKQDAGVAANAGSGALATFFDNKMGYRIGDHNADSLIDAGSLEDSVANAGVASSINDSGDVITYNGYQIKLDWPDYKQQNTMMVHLGTSATEFLQFGIGDMSANGILGSSFEVELSTQKGAQEAISVIKEGIEYVSGERSRIGAVQNRLEHASKNLLQTSENTQNAESRIRDIDMASEMVSYSKNKILMQAGQSMLAQANQQNQGILSLIQ